MAFLILFLSHFYINVHYLVSTACPSPLLPLCYLSQLKVANLHIIRSKMRLRHFLNFEEKCRAFLVDIRDRTSSAVNLTERKIPTLPHFSPLFSYRGFAFFYSKDVLKV